MKWTCFYWRENQRWKI